jgi:hypothetical protein
MPLPEEEKRGRSERLRHLVCRRREGMRYVWYLVSSTVQEIILMATVPTADSPLKSAIEACISAPRRIADYELEPSLETRLLDLGERKEFLNQAEHDELMALVDFTRKRTIESLEAKRALDRVRNAFPEWDVP